MPEPLTAARLRTLKPTDRVDMADGACRGLTLRVAPGRPWKWTLRLHVGEGFRRFGLGDYSDDHGIRWARAEAERLRHEVTREGRDPVQERRQKAADGITLKALTEQWRDEHLSLKSEKYRKEAMRALENAFEGEWTKPAACLTPDQIDAALKRLRDPKRTQNRRRGAEGDGSAIARNTQRYGNACYEWAKEKRVVAANPFDLVSIRDFAVENRDRVLDDQEIGAVWRAAGELGRFGQIVRLMILTGAREQEVAATRWGELVDGVWTVPAGRSKNKKANPLPLPALAISLLPHKPNDAGPNDLVFPGRHNQPFSSWSKFKAALDKESGVTGWRLHDLRRTVGTGLQRLGVRWEVNEAITNHISGAKSGVAGIYQRHHWTTEKKEALSQWADNLAKITTPKRPESNP
jgi:integrase